VADSDAPMGSAAPAQLSRRMIIGFGLAAPTLAVPWLSGCAPSDPAIDGPSLTPGTPTHATSSPLESPTASTTAAAPQQSAKAAAPEQALAALAVAILAGAHRKQLSKDRRELLTFLHNAHTAHARAIIDPPPAAAPAKIAGMSLNSSLALLARRESSAAGSYRSTALKVKGSEALLLGSLSAAADSFTAAISSSNPPRTNPVADREPVEVLSEIDAVSELVRQMHAIVYGYQLSIGKFKVFSKQRSKAERELLSQRIFRDRLIAWLRKHSVEVPAAAPAYVPSVVPRNPATAGKLIMHMQTALEPFCGLWLAAAATQQDRQQALTALNGAMKTARSWGARLAAWPGYST
jgi:hypothetical protein